MNSEALFLFLILLLGLVLCSFLGGNCHKEGFNAYDHEQDKDLSANHVYSDGNGDATDMYNSSYDNYNHYNGSSSQLPSGSIYNGPNGGYVVVTTDNNGKQRLKVILMNGGSPVILSPSTNNNNNSNSNNNNLNSTTTYYNSNGHKGSVTKFYGPNGFSATVVKIDGRKAIKITTKDKTIIFKEQGSNSNNYNNYNNHNNNHNNSISSSQYYGSTGNRIQTNNESDNQSNSNNYGGPYGGSVDTYHGPRASTYNVQQNTQSHFDPYDSALPPGIPASQIPRGDEHLYILKSEVVPPVCPVCPTTCNTTRKEPCPACPPCGRCPEPSFECKKVPNYNAINDSYLPVPVLNDFSSFGM